MPRLVIHSAAEQAAAHLRDGLFRGTWTGLMPGSDRLAEELGVGRDTIEAAMRILEKEGLLLNRGRRRGRQIVLPSGARGGPQIRVAILVNETYDRNLDYVVDLRHRLNESGHNAFYSTKSMAELDMDVKQIARMVNQTVADAWLVIGGSRELLEWFSAREMPTFALFGRRRGLPIAGVGPDKPPAIAEATRALIGFGHRRIVLLTRSARRLPQPGATERAFLDELANHGIEPGPYHLPDWEESIDGFHVRLDSLFRLTPPTALIVDEAWLFVAAFQFCANRNLLAPRDLSLVCTDADQTFAWCRPTVAHIRWDSVPVVRRVVRWATNVSHGSEDRRQMLTPAEFVPGGTIGPVPSV